MRRILAKYSDPKAGGTVALIDPSSKKHATLSIPYASLGGLSVSEAGGRLLLATLGTSPKKYFRYASLHIDCSNLASSHADSPGDFCVHTAQVDVAVNLIDELIFLIFSTVRQMPHTPPCKRLKDSDCAGRR